MIQTESLFTAQVGYMEAQPELNDNIRAILVDWLMEVHLKFKLVPETLFLTVNLLDRFCSSRQVQKSQVQLAGVACMMLAAKYEEIYPPTLKDFVVISKNTFSGAEILGMEQ